jgi:hypothetical protein
MRNCIVIGLICQFLCVCAARASVETGFTPVLEFCTYIGGSDNDRAHDMATDGQGNVYVTGPIHSSNFPTTENAIQKRATGVYVAELNTTNAELMLSTYIGIPGGANYAHGVAVDKKGCIYLAGNTTNARFPITQGAFDTTYNGTTNNSHGDAFVMKLNPEGKMVYSTFIGGSGMDICGKIAVDSEGNAYILGCTSSADFPVTPDAYDTVSHGQSADGRDDIFVAKLNGDGSKLLYCTYIGGSSVDVYNSILVDSSGCAYICGTTCSDDFPTTANAYDQTYNGGSGYHGQGDGFLVKVNPFGTDLDYATFIGGDQDDSINNITFDEQGNVYIAGSTQSTDFPTTLNAYQRTLQGGDDGFLMKFSPDISQLTYATLLGGSRNDNAQIQIGSGLLYLSGSTESPDFPTTENAYDRSFNGNTDIFITIFDPNTQSMVYSTYLGGKGYERGNLRVDNNIIYLAGETTSRDFPVTDDAYDTTYNGGNQNFGGDVFITKFNLP